MAELTEYLQRLRHAQPSAGMDVSVEMLNHFPELNPSIVENFSVNDFSVEYSSLAHQQPEFPATYYHNNLASCFYPDILSIAPVLHTVTLDLHDFHESKKRKVTQQSTSGSVNIFPTASATNTKKKNISLGRRKKGKNKKEREVDKAEEVIHVRAKRGQATDSHSIAERVRREKINNKLRCLQDLVPGCKKSMGMAVMLEEIINYVHSLQNQVEFLSMELAAASCPYDLMNDVTQPSKKAQETNSAAAQEMQKWLREKHGGNTCFHSTWSI